MDEKLRALLILNKECSDGAKVWKAFLRAKLPYRALWEASASELAILGLSHEIASRIRKTHESAWPEKEIERSLQLGVRIIAAGSEEYPERLGDLPSPPLLLYWYGNAENLPKKTVGVVGTRRATAYGKKTAAVIGEMCAADGIGLVSGGALGIDGNAHAGTCRFGGETFAVFGTGVDQIFPSSHRALFEEIRENGALISEFPFGTKGEPWRFPRRNRIVAAMSDKIVVVEAPLKSGAMITARIALDLGRELWAVPGRIDEEVAEGTNRLIFDGAQPLINMDTFFGLNASQSLLFGETDLRCSKEHCATVSNLSREESAVLEILKLSGGRTVDNIAHEVKMSAAEVLKIITMLSALGAVYSSGPGRYSSKV